MSDENSTINIDNEFVEIIPAFSKSLVALEGAGTGILELGIDSVLKDGALRDLPIVGTLTSLLKFGYGIRERNFLKQTAVFINTLNDGTISKDDLYKYREAFECDPKKAEKELGRVILLLDGHFESVASKVLAKLYQAYIAHHISWEQFAELSAINSRMLVGDYKILETFYGANESVKLGDRAYGIDRLVALGLMEKHVDLRPKREHEGAGLDKATFAALTILGKLFMNIIAKELTDI